MKNILKKNLVFKKIIGPIFVFISIYFLFGRILKNWNVILQWHYNFSYLIAIFAGISFFVLGCLILSMAWAKLLTIFGEKNVNQFACVGIYGRSNIAKYFPGNVFHLAGRQILGANYGYSHGTIAFATLFETFGMLFTAGLISLIGGSFFGSNFQYLGRSKIVIVFLLIIIIIGIFLKIISKDSIQRKLFKKEIYLKDNYKNFGAVFFHYLIFFTLIGLSMVLTVFVISGFINPSKIAAVVAIFGISWIIGLITPGAPSGIGIREAIIVATLSGVLGEAQSVIIAIVFRLITTFGDLVFWGVALLPKFSLNETNN
jgi:uncharacterized membrane protein YbhN (UPF0104 family)